jgi:hypothetical protein
MGNAAQGCASKRLGAKLMPRKGENSGVGTRHWADRPRFKDRGIEGS